MKKSDAWSIREIVVIILLFVLGIGFAYYTNNDSDNSVTGDVILPSSFSIETICFDPTCFSVELAVSPEERQKGLSFREELAENTGMLFIFQEEGTHAFWMKDTLIPLDLIWIDAQSTVVHIEENAQPCEAKPCLVMNPETPSLYVLEVNAGTVATENLQLGQKVSFR